jgi:hypothetical protein
MRLKSNSNRLVKSRSLYSYLTSHLAKIHPLNCSQFEQPSQIEFHITHNTGAPYVILFLCLLPHVSH